MPCCLQLLSPLPACSVTTDLYDASGIIGDGSAASANYTPNTNCTWTVYAPDAPYISASISRWVPVYAPDTPCISASISRWVPFGSCGPLGGGAMNLSRPPTAAAGGMWAMALVSRRVVAEALLAAAASQTQCSCRRSLNTEAGYDTVTVEDMGEVLGMFSGVKAPSKLLSTDTGDAGLLLVWRKLVWGGGGHIGLHHSQRIRRMPAVRDHVRHHLQACCA